MLEVVELGATFIGRVSKITRSDAGKQQTTVRVNQ